MCGQKVCWSKNKFAGQKQVCRSKTSSPVKNKFAGNTHTMDRVQCDPVVGDGNVPGREAVTAHEQVSKHLDTKDTETMERELSQSVNVVFNKIQQPATDKVYYIQASIHFAFRDLVLLKTKNSETNGWISGSLEDDYNFVQEKINNYETNISRIF